MKKTTRVITLLLAVVMMLSLAACGSSDTTESKESGEDVIPDLTGEWTQVNGDDDMYHYAVITQDTITIYWISNGGDSKSLYWAGTYVAPTSADEPYTWESENDHDQTDYALMASTDDTKTITYENGQISYEGSILGTTSTYRLEKTGEYVAEEVEEELDEEQEAEEEVAEEETTEEEIAEEETDSTPNPFAKTPEEMAEFIGNTMLGGVMQYEVDYDDENIYLFTWSNGTAQEVYDSLALGDTESWDLLVETAVESSEALMSMCALYDDIGLNYYYCIVDDTDLETFLLIILNGEVQYNIAGDYGDSETSDQELAGTGAAATAENMEVTGAYSYTNSIGTTYLYLTVKNNSDETAKISVNATALNSEGTAVGADSSYIDAVPSGAEVCVYLRFSDTENAAYFDYTISAEEYTYRDAVLQNITFEESDTDTKVILTCTNNGELTAKFVQVVALFFENGELVNADTAYVTDSDSELKPQESISVELTCRNGYDNVLIYFIDGYSA